MIFFRILFGFDCLIALIVLYFFVEGIGDGSVSSFNMELWLGIIVALAGILSGGWLLNANGRRRTAIALLLILAAPGFVYALFILSMLVFQPRWN